MAYRSSASELPRELPREQPREIPRDLPRGDRWDRDRFAYERDRDRQTDERERFEEHDRYYSRGPSRGPSRVRESSVEVDEFARRGPASVTPRPVEDDYVRERRYYDDGPREAPRYRPTSPSEYGRKVYIDIDREREYRDPSPRPQPAAPRRAPVLLRRQSSLDTFDRRPLPRFMERDREEYGPPARRGDYRPDPYQPIPLPRSRALPPPRIYAERDFDEIRISEPERYGDDEYHTYPERIREREITRTRRRRERSASRTSRATSRRTSRSRTHHESSAHSSSRASSRSASSHSSGASAVTATTAKSEYPKKGKTRIPERLVSKRALIDLGYPFTEEGHTIVVQKALGQQNIDDLLKLSEDYRKAEIEVESSREITVVAPPPPPPEPSRPPTVVERAPTVVERAPTIVFSPPTMVEREPTVVERAPTVVEREPTVVERATTVIEAAPPPPPPAPPAPESSSSSVYEYRRETIVRDVSPGRETSKSKSRTRSRSYGRPREYWHEEAVGPGALAVVGDRRRESDIKAEIARLEAEKEALRTERRHHRHHHHHRHRRSHSTSNSPGGELVRAERRSNGELVLYEEKVENVVEPHRGVRIEKDRKGPSKGLMKAMLATLT